MLLFYPHTHNLKTVSFISPRMLWFLRKKQPSPLRNSKKAEKQKEAFPTGL